MSILTTEEKTAVINQHKKNIEHSKYNLELSIIEENAVSSPSQSNIDDLNAKIADLDAKLDALDAELASL